MNPLPVAVALCFFAAGLFLLVGMLLGLWKWRAMLASANHLAPPYVDIAHRAALLYSFAALVMGELLRYSPYPTGLQLAAAAGPLLFFAIAIAQYALLGWRNTTDNQFAARTWTTTWGTALLAAVEIVGVAVILTGFVQTQLLG